MEFWGIEVKPGQAVKVNPGEESIIRISTAALGEVKKDKASENVPIFVKINDNKMVLGTLSAEKFPQIQYDLMFEKEFELSHGSKSASVFFVGHKSLPDYDSEDDNGLDSDEEEEDGEDVPTLLSNGKPEANKKEVKTESGKATAKADASSSKPKVTIEETKVVPAGDEDSDESDEGSLESDGDDEDESEDGSEDDDDSEDEDDESDDDEETPQKIAVGKKRAAEAVKTPVADKKAKATPSEGQKTGGEGKKGGHVATPYPKAKTPVNSDKPKQQTPNKSGGSVPCKSCPKTFNSEKSLESHSKAKHAAK